MKGLTAEEMGRLLDHIPNAVWVVKKEIPCSIIFSNDSAKHFHQAPGHPPFIHFKDWYEFHHPGNTFNETALDLLISGQLKLRGIDEQGLPYSIAFSADHFNDDMLLIRAERQQNRAQQQWEGNTKAFSTLLSGIAHEINNPTNLILMNSSLLEKMWEDCLPLLDTIAGKNPTLTLGNLPYTEVRNEILPLVSNISDATHRIDATIREIKKFSEIEKVIKTELFDVRETIQQVIESHQTLIEQATNRFSVSTPDGPCPTKGNKELVKQMFSHVIKNSIEALPDKNAGIKIECILDGSWIEIKITDEGCGINENDLNRITDPFFTTKRNDGAAGLGLSLSHTIVRAHGGQLKLSSNEHKGTSVSIFLPAYFLD